MIRRRTIISIIAAAALIASLGRFTHPRADEEEEEKPITSTAAQVSRDSAGNVVIAMRPATQREIGLVVQTLKSVTHRVKVEAYGFVLDPAPFSRLNSDLITAQAALEASSAQYRRSRQLYTEQKNVSLRDLQTAQAAYLTDNARLEVSQQQLRDAWGVEIARMDPRARSELVGKLVDRREAIVRVTVPAGAQLDGLPASATIVALGHEQTPLSARAVYYAPTIDPRMQGQTFLLLADTGEFPLRPGTAVSAYLPSSSALGEQGVMIPRSAVVRYSGRQWIYQSLDGDRFVRRQISPAQSTAQGYFVRENLQSAMRVVVAGAQTLLSEELKAQIRPSD